jgi:hypothetical protein
MTSRNDINSRLWNIANTDANGNVIGLTVSANMSATNAIFSSTSTVNLTGNGNINFANSNRMQMPPAEKMFWTGDPGLGDGFALRSLDANGNVGWGYTDAIWNFTQSGVQVTSTVEALSDRILIQANGNVVANFVGTGLELNGTISANSVSVSSANLGNVANITGTANITGNLVAGNINVASGGVISANGNVAVNGPAFSAYASATTQTITSGSQQKVLFQTEEFDTNNNFASSRFTPTVAGYYQLNAEVRFDGSVGTGECMIIIYKNGSEYKRGWNASGTVWGSSLWAMTVNSLVYANGSTDYFEIYVQQTSGGNLNVTTVNNPAITWFNGCMLRGA